jgi:CBS domain-containing protein
MAVGSICTHRVITVDVGLDVAAAAQVMRENKIGYLIVTDKANAGGAPAGVVTDRDMVVKVMAKAVDPHALTVGDVMTREPLVATEDDGISETLKRMRKLGVRRVPVVGARGQIAGVLSIDDVIDHLVAQLSDVAGTARNEPQAKHRSRA